MKKKVYIVAAILSVLACVMAFFLVTRDVKVDVKVEGGKVKVGYVAGPATDAE